MRAGVVLVVAFCAACYAPQPQPGAPCPDGVCPTGLVCSSATRTCEVDDTPGDAATPNDDAASDGAGVTIDAPLDAPPCYGAGIVSVCPVAPITMPLSITANTTIDTTADPLCIAYTGGSENAYCVVAATTISIAQNRRLRANGTRPLVLLATGSITVDGTIDVSAGAAATNPFACVPPTAATGAQGGAGGSFKGKGGAGGGETNGLGPPASAPVTTVAFRGGCDGARGGGGNAGAGGSGGGAVYLIASSITISGTVDAGGGGGSRGVSGSPGSGGGGGGAGGFVGLDAATVTVDAGGRVVANGGGGGEGATRYKSGNSGAAGGASIASGGSGGANHGGNGGAGSFGASLTGEDGRAGGTCGRGAESGGGGGGGAGLIYVFPAQPLGGTISPPPTS